MKPPEESADAIITAYMLMVTGFDSSIVIDTLPNMYLSVLSQMNPTEIERFHSMFIKAIMQAKLQAEDGYGTPN